MTENTRRRLRNISVIAHVDHGKTTLSDALIRASGLSTRTGFIDSVREDQVERGITIKSTAVSMDLLGHQVNLIDSPGHVDFSSEVSAALRITDGALVVVDCISGPAVQTRTVLRQAVREGVVPTLVCNKLDRAFLEQKLGAEELYLLLRGSVEATNALIASFQGEHQLDPLSGNVAFGSGKQGWMFTLPQVAKLYAEKLNTKPDQILKLLWGERFHDPATNRWSKSGGDQRGFCKLIVDPLWKIFRATKDKLDWNLLCEAFSSFGLVPPSRIKSKSPKEAQAMALVSLFPAEAALLDLIIDHLPSPAQAQTYRTPLLYTGPLDDKVAEAIRTSDPEGPLCVFISKLLPGKRNKDLFALGRVFSGTLKNNTDVTVLDTNYNPKKPKHLRVTKVRDISRPRGPTATIPLQSAFPGDIVLIGGLGGSILKTATLCTCSDELLYPIRQLKLTVQPVVHRAVSVAPAGLGAFQSGLTVLSKTDPLASVVRDPVTQEVVIGASGELHLEILLSDLQMLLGKHKLIQSEPLVSYHETVTTASSQVALAKSSNKHNRVFSTAQPLTEEQLTHCDDQESVDFDDVNGKKVWACGDVETGANALVDISAGVAYLNESRSAILDAMREVAFHGPLAGEPLRGVRLNVVDAKFHGDKVHRSAAQVIPAAKRSFKAACLLAGPALMEPVFKVTVEVPSPNVAQIVYSIISGRRGVVEEELRGEHGTIQLVCHLPVAEAFGLDSVVRERTSGAAFCALSFSHHSRVPGDPLDSSSLAGEVVSKIRKRKGLKPTIELSLDRL